MSIAWLSNTTGSTTHALTWQEVLPQPWTLPSTSETALSCVVKATSKCSRDGVMVSQAAAALGHGAYFIQQRRDDGCHKMRTFEVDCDQCPGDVNGDGIVDQI